METWGQGDYSFDTVVANLRKLENVLPEAARGKPQTSNHLTYDVSSDEEEGVFMTEDADETQAKGMPMSLFVTPENFFAHVDLEEELFEWGTIHDDQNVYVARDWADHQDLEEHEAYAILANWGQVRQYLHDTKLGRGYVKPKLPTDKKLSLIHI